MKIGKDRHHRRCKSNGGANTPNNISIVERVKHNAFHTLFGNKDVIEIANTLNRTWIDPRFELIVKEKDYA